MKDEFDWNEGNIRHIVHDHPERGNTVEEVESLFDDEYFIGGFDRDDPLTGEQRYWGIGIGTQGIVKYVVYVDRNDKIRPITCHTAKRNQRQFYHEQAEAKRAQQTDSGRDEEFDVP